MSTKKNLSLLAAGVAMAAVTLLGVFALITDTADTGTFSFESQDEASSIDLQIKDGVVGSTADCAAQSGFVENATASFLSADDQAPGAVQTKYVCVRNVGAQSAFIDLELFGTTNTETGCTGDEPDYDTTCGSGAGELGPDLTVDVTKVGNSATGNVNCDEADKPGVVSYTGVADTAAQNIGDETATSQIGGGEYACYRVVTTYPLATPSAEVQEDQSDQVAWQFKFHGDLS